MQQATDPAANGGRGPARSARHGADLPSLLAIAAVCVGWLMLDAGALRAGHVITSFRFYQLAAVIYRPSRVLAGVGNSDLMLTIPFVLVCCAAIVAALAPRFSLRPLARLGLFAPLVLMIACGVILYIQASGDTFVVAPDADQVRSALAKLGNAIMRRTTTVLAQHISASASAGTWVSAIGAVYLAYTGVGSLRRPTGS